MKKGIKFIPQLCLVAQKGSLMDKVACFPWFTGGMSDENALQSNSSWTKNSAFNAGIHISSLA